MDQQADDRTDIGWIRRAVVYGTVLSAFLIIASMFTGPLGSIGDESLLAIPTFDHPY